MSAAKKSFVFCHGLWADGSCFSKVIAPLQAQGHECIAAQYGLNSSAEDIAITKAAMGQMSHPIILVGHSYGGSVITGAGTDDRVVGLVYIAGLAPDAGEQSQERAADFPETPVFSQLEPKDGRLWLLRDGTQYFCGDLSEQEQSLVWATQGAPIPSLLEEKIDGVAWKTKPSWYIVARNDKTLHPDFERFLAARMGAKTHEIHSSHVPMLSRPEEVLQVLMEAANA